MEKFSSLFRNFFLAAEEKMGESFKAAIWKLTKHTNTLPTLPNHYHSTEQRWGRHGAEREVNGVRGGGPGTGSAFKLVDSGIGTLSYLKKEC